jgi:hypothetical protein
VALAGNRARRGEPRRTITSVRWVRYRREVPCNPLIPGPRERHQQRTMCSFVQIALGERAWFVATEARVADACRPECARPRLRKPSPSVWAAVRRRVPASSASPPGPSAGPRRRASRGEPERTPRIAGLCWTVCTTRLTAGTSHSAPCDLQPVPFAHPTKPARHQLPPMDQGWPLPPGFTSG